jgi:hypothetical protein
VTDGERDDVVFALQVFIVVIEPAQGGCNVTGDAGLFCDDELLSHVYSLEGGV